MKDEQKLKISIEVSFVNCYTCLCLFFSFFNHGVHFHLSLLVSEFFSNLLV